MADDKEKHSPEHEKHHKPDEVSGKENVPPREAMEEAAEAGAEHHSGWERDETLERSE